MSHSAEGLVVDIDYINIENFSRIRITLRDNEGSSLQFIDETFSPYFYILSDTGLNSGSISSLLGDEENKSVLSVEDARLMLNGKERSAVRITVKATKDVKLVSESLRDYGVPYEYDVLFWKRYVIDKQFSPMHGVRITYDESDGKRIIREIRQLDDRVGIRLSHICFDIETYNPLGVPRPEKDPVIMISYMDGNEKRVITTKPIDRDFVTLKASEKDLIEEFSGRIAKLDYDVISGYNSSNFDLPYLLARAKKTSADFLIGRSSEEIKQEHHGLVEAVKIPGRINADIYNVAKFVSIVGASEKLLRANRFTLGEVYRAITGDMKVTVEKKDIWKLWDGTKEELEELADYSLSDSVSLDALYNFFIPLEIEIASIVGTTLSEACVSTTGQLVEHFLMRYARRNNELIPNKPSEEVIARRNANPIEGAYVKTPEAGIYDRIAVFDFRGLYPSIIIAHNIDPSTIASESEDAYVSPDGTRFKKSPQGIIPKALKLLISERTEVKKLYKKDPDNKEYAARSQALKIIANSFYGYLGYSRSRWYSRECAASVTAYGRDYISKTMEQAEAQGFRVLYGDTDSIFLLMGDKSKEDAMRFLSDVNKSLPESMELELEDFYVRGVFVGKKGGTSGAKKKYAMLSESGRIKIKGFELVRRDWSNISRETQRKVLEAILKDGSKEKAVGIVKDVIRNLREGKVQMKDLVIYTQLRKRIDSYDSSSPELSAAKKAIEQKVKKKSDLEGATIGYVVSRGSGSISEKAVLEELAENYDPDYYIKHQVIPATLKILKELGFSEEELQGMGSQKKL